MRDVGRDRLSYSPSLTDARMNAMMDSWGRPIQTGPEHLVVHPHAALIGERLRRKRIGSGLTQAETVAAVENPRGGNYSTGLLSRMERGWANSPLYAYIHFAEALDLGPGPALGPESGEDVPSDAELTLLEALRGAEISPHDALARLLGEAG